MAAGRSSSGRYLSPAYLAFVLIELCLMLALGAVCAAPVLAMLGRLNAHSLTYGLAGFGIGFFVLTTVLGARAAA